MDPEKRRALSQFYREEFARHLQHIETSGIVGPASRDALDCAYRRLLTELDSVCWRADFPAVAESLLQSFDVLTRLSQLDPRQGH